MKYDIVLIKRFKMVIVYACILWLSLNLFTLPMILENWLYLFANLGVTGLVVLIFFLRRKDKYGHRRW